MKSAILAFGLLGMGLTACQQTPASQQVGLNPQDFTSLEQFAVAAVYDAHPTRALVDKIEQLPSEDGHALVRVEMTGAPTVRDIYKLHITPLEDGTYQLEKIEILQ